MQKNKMLGLLYSKNSANFDGISLGGSFSQAY